jgi:hypothetical protein
MNNRPAVQSQQEADLVHQLMEDLDRGVKLGATVSAASASTATASAQVSPTDHPNPETTTTE